MALKLKFICLLVVGLFGATLAAPFPEGDTPPSNTDEAELESDSAPPPPIPETCEDDESDSSEDRCMNDEVDSSDDGSDEEMQKRKATSDESRRWPNAVVPYVFMDSFDDKHLGYINKAIAEWEKFTCVDFRERTADDPNYIRIFNSGCSSVIGMKGGKQGVHLGCKSKRLALHEFGHALGLEHPHQRPDRDNWVTVHEGGIKTGNAWRFKKLASDKINSYDTLYDYLSVLHYGPKDFSNGQRVLETKDPFYQSLISKSTILSFRDIRIVNLMYSCNASCPAPQECPGEGFVGEDCQCWCPGNPRQPCGESHPKLHHQTICKDNNKYCASWAKGGQCTKNPSYMKVQCRASCKICNPNCKDFDAMCDYYSHTGWCDSNPAFMTTNCTRSCRLCDP